MQDDPLIIAGHEFRSRLIIGTGKYRTMEEMRDAIDASGAEMITVAIRRLPLDKPDEPRFPHYRQALKEVERATIEIGSGRSGLARRNKLC